MDPKKTEGTGDQGTQKSVKDFIAEIDGLSGLIDEKPELKAGFELLAQKIGDHRISQAQKKLEEGFAEKLSTETEKKLKDARTQWEKEMKEAADKAKLEAGKDKLSPAEKALLENQEQIKKLMERLDSYEQSQAQKTLQQKAKETGIPDKMLRFIRSEEDIQAFKDALPDTISAANKGQILDPKRSDKERVSLTPEEDAIRKNMEEATGVKITPEKWLAQKKEIERRKGEKLED